MGEKTYNQDAAVLARDPYNGWRPTREEAIKTAGAALAWVLAEQDALSPREAAERAHQRGGPSVEELEALIRAERGLPAIDCAEPEPVVEKPRRTPKKVAPKSDPLAAVAGMTLKQMRALAEVLRAELG